MDVADFTFANRVAGAAGTEHVPDGAGGYKDWGSVGRGCERDGEI